MRLSRLIYLGLNHHAGAKATYFLQAIKYTPVTLKLHTEQNVALTGFTGVQLSSRFKWTKTILFRRCGSEKCVP